MTAETKLTPIGKDDVYFWHNVCFSVEGYLFQVPRYQFIVGSEHFAEKYKLGESHAANAGESDAVVELEGVTTAQFRTFLKLLFPIHSASTTLTFTKEEWLTILTLSTLWRFHEFRKLAIDHLDLTDPVELVQVGRAAYVSKWIRNGYQALVRKSGAITEEECDEIGDRTAIRLYIIRHGNAGGGKDMVGEDIETKFSGELMSIKLQEMERRTKGEMEDERRMEEEAGKRAEEARRKLEEEKEERAKAVERHRQRSEEEEAKRSEKEKEFARLVAEEERLSRYLDECREKKEQLEESEPGRETKTALVASPAPKTGKVKGVEGPAAPHVANPECKEETKLVHGTWPPKSSTQQDNEPNLFSSLWR